MSNRPSPSANAFSSASVTPMMGTSNGSNLVGVAALPPPPVVLVADSLGPDEHAASADRAVVMKTINVVLERCAKVFTMFLEFGGYSRAAVKGAWSGRELRD